MSPMCYTPKHYPHDCHNFIRPSPTYPTNARYGFNKRLGPVNLMDDEEEYLQTGRTRTVADLGTELARIALGEVTEVGG